MKSPRPMRTVHGCANVRGMMGDAVHVRRGYKRGSAGGHPLSPVVFITAVDGPGDRDAIAMLTTDQAERLGHALLRLSVPAWRPQPKPARRARRRGRS